MENKKSCGQCGSDQRVRFDGESFRIEHRGDSIDVRDLAGFRCSACGEVEFDAQSAARYAAAGDALVLAVRKRTGDEIRRIRTKLGLSQLAASQLTGGGHNAFSRYERGEVMPMPSVLNLLKLLDRHPELLAELDAREPAAAG